MRKLFLEFIFLLPFLLLFSCSSTLKVYQKNTLFSSNHCGFMLFDPETSKTLAEVNSAKYFTPASNTKIFTLYAGLKVLGDSLPALRYENFGDSLIIWGTGDPTFLNAEFNYTNTYDFLKNREENLFMSFDNFQEDTYGPGWAWDDFNYAYSLERSSMPLFGNRYEIHKGSDTTELSVYPVFFQEFIDSKPGPAPINESFLQKDLSSNAVTYYIQDSAISFTRNVPIHWDKNFLVQVLSDTLKKEVKLAHKMPSQQSKYLAGVPADSVFKVMMQESDNFLAEQILLMVSEKVSDTLRTKIGIDYTIQNHLSDLPDEPVWVDGSGLSRYNLFTPRSIVALLDKLYNEADKDRVFELFAAGGESGTIKDWYKGNPPFVYAKTGTLSNNHCLSGYVVTKKGKTLIFSFMNNNYNDVSSTFKVEMEKMLEHIYEKY